MLRINLISWQTGAGIERDHTLLVAVLRSAGHRVSLSCDSPVLSSDRGLHRGLKHLRRLGQRFLAKVRQATHRWVWRRILHRPPYDLNLFIERVDPAWYASARVNALIPNPEWFKPEWLPRLAGLDCLLVKTHHAIDQFAIAGKPCHYIGFTSDDRFLPQVAKDDRRWFHLAGSSISKGTATLVQLWQQHPEWPELILVQTPKYAPFVAPEISLPNLTFIYRRLAESELRTLQNSCGVHLCPSEAEGFGHTLVESMSCGAVVVTTDGPPMNELIRPDRGVLAAYGRAEPWRLGVNYYVAAADLERQIERILALDPPQRRSLGDQARAWYLAQHQDFAPRFLAVLESLVMQRVP